MVRFLLSISVVLFILEMQYILNVILQFLQQIMNTKTLAILLCLRDFVLQKGGITIEDDVRIGAGTVILDGAILGRGCVIGAMSLVRQEVLELRIYAGSPLARMGIRR